MNVYFMLEYLSLPNEKMRLPSIEDKRISHYTWYNFTSFGIHFYFVCAKLHLFLKIQKIV